MNQIAHMNKNSSGYEIPSGGLILLKITRVEGGITADDRGHLVYRFVPREGTVTRALQVLRDDIDTETTLGNMPPGCKVTANIRRTNVGTQYIEVNAENLAEMGNVSEFKKSAAAIMRMVIAIKNVYEDKGQVFYPEQEARRD